MGAFFSRARCPAGGVLVKLSRDPGRRWGGVRAVGQRVEAGRPIPAPGGPIPAGGPTGPIPAGGPTGPSNQHGTATIPKASRIPTTSCVNCICGGTQQRRAARALGGKRACLSAWARGGRLLACCRYSMP